MISTSKKVLDLYKNYLNKTKKKVNEYMNSYEHISMVVLAGGKSSRMGTDKADVLYQGKSFLEIQIEKGSR